MSLDASRYDYVGQQINSHCDIPDDPEPEEEDMSEDEISELRARVAELEKELTFHHHKVEERHNRGLGGMPQGPCSCDICRSFYAEGTKEE